MMRRAVLLDLPAIVAVIEEARAFLKAQGLDQWQQSAYPAAEDIVADIEKGIGYVLTVDEEIAGYAAVMTGFDPAYDKIQGAWLNHHHDYVTIHRLAISNQFRGQALGQAFLKEIFETFSAHKDFRVDTHPDNQVMQHILAKLEFKACGVVMFEGERLAYQRLEK